MANQETTELEYVTAKQLSCDGGTDNGHPLVYLHIDDDGEVVCPYCSKKFVYKAG